MESIPDSHDLLHFCISYEYHEYMETFKSLGVFTFLDFAKFKINFMFPDFTLTSGKVPRQSEKNGFVSLMNLFLEKSDNRQKSNIETNFVFYKKISCVTIGKFDALSFEFDFDHWNPSPAVFLNDLQFKASDKVEEFVLYCLNKFSNEISNRLMKVFPYNIDNNELRNVVVIFCSRIYMLPNYSTLHDNLNGLNIIDFFINKIKNKYKTHIVKLKSFDLMVEDDETNKRATKSNRYTASNEKIESLCTKFGFNYRKYKSIIENNFKINGESSNSEEVSSQ